MIEEIKAIFMERVRAAPAESHLLEIERWVGHFRGGQNIADFAAVAARFMPVLPPSVLRAAKTLHHEVQTALTKDPRLEAVLRGLASELSKLPLDGPPLDRRGRPPVNHSDVRMIAGAVSAALKTMPTVKSKSVRYSDGPATAITAAIVSLIDGREVTSDQIGAALRKRDRSQKT